MDPTKFAAWKYQHAGAGCRSRRQTVVAAILLLAAVIAYAASDFPPLSIGLAIGALITFFYSTKKIFLGPRYLICGNTIVYYHNVVRLSLDEAAGQLLLLTASDQTFTLQRDKFPSNARKADKIVRNQAAKFSKVANHIIARVQHAAPGVHLDGQA